MTLYFLYHSDKDRFESYLWFFLFLLVLVSAIVKLHKLANKLIEPVISISQSFIVIKGGSINPSTINEDSLIDIKLKKNTIFLKLDNGMEKVLDVSSLSYKNQQEIFSFFRKLQNQVSLRSSKNGKNTE